jgi:hypothetical protein
MELPEQLFALAVRVEIVRASRDGGGDDSRIEHVLPGGLV